MGCKDVGDMFPIEVTFENSAIDHYTPDGRYFVHSSVVLVKVNPVDTHE